MPNYLLYAGSPENSRQALITHSRRISQARLRQWFGEALHTAGRAERKRALVRMRGYLQHALEQGDKRSVQTWRRSLRDPEVRVEDVFDHAVDVLCAAHGFARVPYVHVVDAFGAWDTCYPKRQEFGKRG